MPLFYHTEEASEGFWWNFEVDVFNNFGDNGETWELWEEFLTSGKELSEPKKAQIEAKMAEIFTPA